MLPPDNVAMPARVMRAKSAYHTKDVAREKRRKAEYERKRVRSSRSIPVEERRVIAWDGEGVKLSGERKPQHYVLFGCSVDTGNPLRILTPKDDLDFFRLADYIVSIGARYPNAIHVGYFFKYDHNMIIKSLPWPMKAALYEKNAARIRRGDFIYRIRWIPGKSITISREHNGKRTRVTIDDIGPFFARSFVRAYEATFPLEDRGSMWPIVVEGKAMRADTTWDDMDTIEHYWRAEIIALERLAVWFRDLMCEAGFPLTKWYGPGALANLLRRRHGLAEHEWGGKVENMPPEVHDATKRAYFGGHVEQYQAGRVTGPVYVLDINSAYPAAFATLPSLAQGGEWRYREATLRDLTTRGQHPMTLSVWKARWTMGGRVARSAAPTWPQPLPHRDVHKEITYPPMTTGWYWQPELEAAMRAMLIHKRGTLEVFGGWEWFPGNTERPWAFLEEMYERRAELKAAGNPSEMAFKLGMNSMYGKMAQRAGWDIETKTPPRSHTLPLAGYVTAYCRGQIMSMVQKILDIDPLGVVAVETDGIFTTVSPDALGVRASKVLGEWSVDMYDELMYVQNGVYALRKGERWEKVKTRGMSAASVSPEGLAQYLMTLRAGERWEPLALAQGEVFIGLGSAISRATTTKGQIAWPKAAALHCRWEKQNKDVVPGVRGKRIHIPDACVACQDGVSAHARAHPLRVRSTAINGAVSAPYALPWETGYQETEYERLDRQTTWEERQENT